MLQTASRPPEPKVEGSSPSGDIQEVQKRKALTQSSGTDSVLKNPKLVSGLFSAPELRTVIKRWPDLAPELHVAILKIVAK